MFTELENAIKRRHNGTLEKAIAHGNQSRFKNKFVDVLQEAQELRDHLVNLNNIAHDVLKMNQSTISELRSYKDPKPIVVDIMMATFLILGVKKVFVQVRQSLLRHMMQIHAMVRTFRD